MKNFARAGAAVGLSAGLLFLVAPPVSAGSVPPLPTFDVEVTGTAECLASGQAEVTWTAVVSLVLGPGTTVEVEPIVLEGMRPPLGGALDAVVQFDGVQSGAASGAVSFDPFQQIVPATISSFPVDSQAVVLDPGTTGGAVVLDVTVLVYPAVDPEEISFTAEGAGSVDLPICEQPVAPTSADIAAEATTRPRFTG